MFLRGIKLARSSRSWHLLARIGIATTAVAAATALQLPAEANVPGEPFLLYYVIVVVSAGGFGRLPGLVAGGGTAHPSVLYFYSNYSFRLSHHGHFLVI